MEISLYAQARQSLLLLTQGNIYNRLRFLNKYLKFIEELNELFGENWSLNHPIQDHTHPENPFHLLLVQSTLHVLLRVLHPHTQKGGGSTHILSAEVNHSTHRNWME